jgi:hypothetical protein
LRPDAGWSAKIQTVKETSSSWKIHSNHSWLKMRWNNLVS